MARIRNIFHLFCDRSYNHCRVFFLQPYPVIRVLYTLHHVLGAIALFLGVYILAEIIVGSQHISIHFTILGTFPSRTGLPPTVWEE